MGTFRMSNGDKIKKELLNTRISKAKEIYSDSFLSEKGYHYCERCERNDCNGVSRSHIISVDECQKSGRAELAYCQQNLELLGQKCHLDIESWSHEKRESWYWARQDGIPYEDFIIDYQNNEA